VVAQVTLHTFLLEPDALPDGRVLEHLLARFRDRPQASPNMARMAEALYEYRVGRPSAAIESLRTFRPVAVSTETESQEKVFACAILALAHTKLGQEDEARRQLAMAEELARKAEFSPERWDQLPLNWCGWLRYHILRREAEGLLSATASRPAPAPTGAIRGTNGPAGP
jgi:hypothetical protein